MNEHVFANLNVARQIIEQVEDRLQHQPAAFEPEWARTN